MGRRRIHPGEAVREEREPCLDGELVSSVDGYGRSTEIRYVRDGRTRGFVLRLDPVRRAGWWEPEQGEAQMMEQFEEGRGMLFSSWHDGAEFECDYDAWVEGHVARLRRLACDERRARARRALEAGELAEAAALYEELVRYLARGGVFLPDVALELARCLAETGREDEAALLRQAAAEASAGTPEREP